MSNLKVCPQGSSFLIMELVVLIIVMVILIYTCDKHIKSYIYTYKNECMYNWLKLSKVCSLVN